LPPGITRIQGLIAALQAANPALDLTDLKAEADAVAAIVPETPPSA
jgi:hypothetical protein